MIKINLLPPEERLPRWPLKRIMCIAAIIVFFGLMFTYGYQTYRLWHLEREYQALTVKHQLLKPTEDIIQTVLVEQNTIHAKNNILLLLSKDKFSWYAVIGKFALLTPQNVWLTELSSTDKGGISLKGFTRSYPDLADFMKNLEQDDLFIDPVLIKAESSDKLKGIQFDIVVRIKGL